MTSVAASFLKRLAPSQPPTAVAELLRAGLGALVGILIAGGVSGWWFGTAGSGLLLIAPIGASAVLLFAVPASPLAQPYAFLGGNLLAALVGVTAAQWIDWPLVSAAVAVSGAIVVMALCRCLHPPSGAVALIAVIGGPHVVKAGYDFVLVPVLLNSVLLAAAAIFFNNLTGRTYPHRSHPVVHPSPSRAPLRLAKPDFESVIADYGETLAIDADDLERLFDELVARADTVTPISRR